MENSEGYGAAMTYIVRFLLHLPSSPDCYQAPFPIPRERLLLQCSRFAQTALQGIDICPLLAAGPLRISSRDPAAKRLQIQIDRPDVDRYWMPNSESHTC